MNEKNLFENGSKSREPNVTQQCTVGRRIRAKSMIQTGRRERVPSHLFLIVFDAILLANHVTITIVEEMGLTKNNISLK